MSMRKRSVLFRSGVGITSFSFLGGGNRSMPRPSGPGWRKDGVAT